MISKKKYMNCFTTSKYSSDAHPLTPPIFALGWLDFRRSTPSHFECQGNGVEKSTEFDIDLIQSEGKGLDEVSEG